MSDKTVPVLFTASGEPMPLTQSVDLTLNINDLMLPFTFSVTPRLASNYSIIIGMDNLCKYRCTIDLPNNVLHFYDGLTAVHMRDKPFTRDNAATILKRVILPPRTETILPLSVHQALQQGSYILQANDNIALQNVAIARAVVSPYNATVLCRVLNPTNSPIELRRKTIIATLEPIADEDLLTFDSCAAINTVDATCGSHAEANKSSANDIINDLGIDLSNADLNPEQKQRFIEFLAENSPVFAKDMSELGCTNAYYHHIETNGSAPQRARMYRHPPHLREEIDKQLDMLIKNNIIEEAYTPWQAPILLSKKADGVSYRFLTDLRLLNKVTQPLYCQLPLYDDVISTLAETKPTIFSCLDLQSAFISNSVNSRK